MSFYNYEFDDGPRCRIPLSELERFRDHCLEAAPAARPISERISLCFWLDLLVLTQRYGIALHEVLQPIFDLEKGEPASGIKPATQFTREPLRGLWHKHWFSPRFMAGNLLASMQRRDSMDFIWEIANEGDLLTDDIIKQIAHRVTVAAFENRHAAKKLTGEWIIFLRRDELNYYLCLGTHKTGDQRLHDKITALGALDFPSLPEWLAEADNSTPV